MSTARTFGSMKARRSGPSRCFEPELAKTPLAMPQGYHSRLTEFDDHRINRIKWRAMRVKLRYGRAVSLRDAPDQTSWQPARVVDDLLGLPAVQPYLLQLPN